MPEHFRGMGADGGEDEGGQDSSRCRQDVVESGPYQKEFYHCADSRNFPVKLSVSYDFSDYQCHTTEYCQ